MSAPTFAFLMGVFYLAFGIFGALPSLLAPPPTGAPPLAFDALYGLFLGLFPVNLAHDFVHAAIGVWGLAAWAGAASALRYARITAALFFIIALMGLVPGLNTFFGYMPVYGNDVWLNLLTAATAGYFGYRTLALAEPAAHGERRRGTSIRRQSMRPVAYERRKGPFDRRAGGGTLAAG